MSGERAWRNKQVAEMFGITSRLLIDLTEKGVISADIDPGGRGNARWYSFENLFELVLYQELNALNLGYRHIKYLIEFVREHPRKYTGTLVYRARRDAPALWCDIKSDEEMLSKEDGIDSEDDNIFELFGCATVKLDLRLVRKIVELKIK